MFTRRLIVNGAILVFCSAASIAQQTAASSSATLREFPVILQQNVQAGKTPVGAKIQAKLAAATQFQGTVIPKNAVLTIVVVQSVAKSANDKARLAIRMISATWNGGWVPVYAYLMPLYYPTTEQALPNLPTESPDPTSRTMTGAGQSGSSPMAGRPSPGNGSEDSQVALPNIPATSTSPVRMKDVALAPTSDGGIALVSEHANIKLHKQTTYVFASDESSAK